MRLQSLSRLRPLEPARSPDPVKAKTAALATLIATAAALAGVLLFSGRRRAQRDETEAFEEQPGSTLRLRVGVARQLNGGAAILAFAVLTDSGLEHYRGLFFNRLMYTPLVVSTMTLGVSLHGVNDQRSLLHRLRDVVYALAALTGLVGTAFHIYDIGKRPGGYAFQNLFYAAPIGAPFALSLAGLLGVAAERVRHTGPGGQPRLAGFPLSRILAAVTAIGLLGSVGEVGLLHFRGAYHNPFMFIPVTLPPIAAVSMASAAVSANGSPHSLTRAILKITAALGVIGVGFHAYGISRNMGGWRNWSQNILNGPPVPAPPSFTGLSLAGLAALRLLENEP